MKGDSRSGAGHKPAPLMEIETMKKINAEPTTRPATIEDFYRGSILYNSSGSRVVLGDKYDDGVWNSHAYSGTRHIGAGCVFEGEAKFYQVKVQS